MGQIPLVEAGLLCRQQHLRGAISYFPAPALLLVSPSKPYYVCASSMDGISVPLCMTVSNISVNLNKKFTRISKSINKELKF